MHIFKTQATALKHLQQGTNFKNKPLQLFWKDRAVCIEAFALDTSNFYLIRLKNPGIEWDAAFMADAFNRTIEDGRSIYPTYRFGSYLPPEITHNKDILLKAAPFDLFGFPSYFAPDLLYDQEIHNAYSGKMFPLVPNTISILMEHKIEFSDLLTISPNGLYRCPKDLGWTRDVCAAVCLSEESFAYAFGGLDDDETFVLEVLKQIPEHNISFAFRTASYRIRRAVRKQDPFTYLEKFVQAKTLSDDLNRKPFETTDKPKAIKA